MSRLETLHATVTQEQLEQDVAAERARAFAEHYAAQIITVHGVQASVKQLEGLCPIPPEQRNPIANAAFVAKVLYAGGVEVAPEWNDFRYVPSETVQQDEPPARQEDAPVATVKVTKPEVKHEETISDVPVSIQQKEVAVLTEPEGEAEPPVVTATVSESGAGGAVEMPQGEQAETMQPQAVRIEEEPVIETQRIMPLHQPTLVSVAESKQVAVMAEPAEVVKPHLAIVLSAEEAPETVVERGTEPVNEPTETPDTPWLDVHYKEAPELADYEQPEDAGDINVAASQEAVLAAQETVIEVTRTIEAALETAPEPVVERVMHLNQQLTMAAERLAVLSSQDISEGREVAAIKEIAEQWCIEILESLELEVDDKTVRVLVAQLLASELPAITEDKLVDEGLHEFKLLDNFTAQLGVLGYDIRNIYGKHLAGLALQSAA